MGPGGSRGLQSRCGTMQNVPGVFDSHAFPPFFLADNISGS